MPQSGARKFLRTGLGKLRGTQPAPPVVSGGPFTWARIETTPHSTLDTTPWTTRELG